MKNMRKGFTIKMVNIKARIIQQFGRVFSTYGEKGNENIMLVNEAKRELHKLKKPEQDVDNSRDIIRSMDFDGDFGMRYFKIGTRVKSEKYEGRNCYVLIEGFGKNYTKTWIDKETMLPVKQLMVYTNKSSMFSPNVVNNVDYNKKETETAIYETFYKVEYGTVTDKDVEMPSTEEYNVITSNW
ncbi:MAG: hypothetical protein HFJ24_07645 [Clostridia bacterium]|nr:hypothetical protein [Clostridia bacterium]MCI9275782.1 hypothetical protein [Clostridia bacterium]